MTQSDNKIFNALLTSLIVFLFFLLTYNTANAFRGREQAVENKSTPLLGGLKLDLHVETVIDSSKQNNECDVHFIRDMVLNSEGNITVLTYDHMYKFNDAGNEEVNDSKIIAIPLNPPNQ